MPRQKNLLSRINRCIKLINVCLKSHCIQSMDDFEIKTIREYTFVLETLVQLKEHLKEESK